MSKESLPFIAAAEWARAHASTSHDPVKFGRDVTHVYVAAQPAQHHTGPAQRPASEVYDELVRSAYAPLVTPDYIKAKAVDVLHQVNGLSYSDALYALDVAQRTMRDAVERLHQEQVFSPPIFQPRSPKDSGGHP